MARREILDAVAVHAAVDKLADGILGSAAGTKGLALIGIHTLGVPLAERLARRLTAARPDLSLLRGTLDITLYRDDLSSTLHRPQVRGSEIAFDVAGKRVVLVDDVCYTGRTARAAIEQVMDFGRPRLIELAVLIDRGHRELPIQPTYVGHAATTTRDEIVRVFFDEAGGHDSVVVETAAAAANPSKL